MKRITSVFAALALVALMAAPVSANTMTLTKATVTQAGLVSLYGTVVCPPEMSGQGFQIGGDVTQVFNHKYIVNGQINGSGQCAASGVTGWSVVVTANTNKFSTGSAIVNLNFQGGGCTDPNDPSTCYGIQDGGQLVVKLTRK